jgi:hypothetical protein
VRTEGPSSLVSSALQLPVPVPALSLRNETLGAATAAVTSVVLTAAVTSVVLTAAVTSVVVAVTVAVEENNGGGGDTRPAVIGLLLLLLFSEVEFCLELASFEPSPTTTKAGDESVFAAPIGADITAPPPPPPGAAASGAGGGVVIGVAAESGELATAGTPFGLRLGGVTARRGALNANAPPPIAPPAFCLQLPGPGGGDDEGEW